MVKRILSLIISISVVIIFQSSVHAQSPSLFGPNKYTRTTGAPNTYQDIFQACNTGAIYNLIVENGEEGKDRLSSASLSLNGQEIVREDEFNQEIDKIEKTIYLQQKNTLNIKLASGPSGFIKVSVYCVANCLEIKITSPATGSAINKSKTIIKGSLHNAFGETGVTIQSSGASGQVSGLAQTQASNFAGSTPLQTGTNTIIATATDACGYQVTDAITINTETREEPVRLTATPTSGIPNATTGTFETTLEAEVNIENPISKYSWDINGDGTPEQEGSNLTKVTTNYQNTGLLYFPSVTITDTSGNTYTETTIVNVLSKEEMDALLKTKWEGMRGGLTNGEIEKALRYFAEDSKEKYRTIYNIIDSNAPGGISVVAMELPVPALIEIINNVATHVISRAEDGRQMEYTLYFVLDNSGIWKILEY